MSDTIVIRDTDTDTVLVDDAPGPPGRAVVVHWATEPPTASDGAVGDLWVVTTTP